MKVHEEVLAEHRRMRAQLQEALALLSGGTPYERSHLEAVLQAGLPTSTLADVDATGYYAETGWLAVALDALGDRRGSCLILSRDRPVVAAAVAHFDATRQYE
jgi:hypothetical protein